MALIRDVYSIVNSLENHLKVTIGDKQVDWTSCYTFTVVQSMREISVNSPDRALVLLNCFFEEWRAIANFDRSSMVV